MALIQCPDCNNDMSDKAPACPKCGCPNKQQHWVADQYQNTQPIQQVITTQATAKKYKGMEALGFLGICAGFALMFASPPFGLVVLVLSVIPLAYATIGAWWHHG